MLLKETRYTDNPVYICDKCGVKMLYRPKRLCLQEHNTHYGHQTVEHYDLCDRHYEIFMNWLNNVKKEK